MRVTLPYMAAHKMPTGLYYGRVGILGAVIWCIHEGTIYFPKAMYVMEHATIFFFVDAQKIHEKTKLCGLHVKKSLPIM